MDSRLILIVIEVISAAYELSEAISCYSCDSITKSNCQDPFKSDGIKTCTGAKHCSKNWAPENDVVVVTHDCSNETTECTEVKVGDIKGVTVVTRDCSNDTTENDGCKDVTVGDIKGKVCLCRTDYCNDGQLVQPALYNFVTGAAMATVVSVVWMKQC